MRVSRLLRTVLAAAICVSLGLTFTPDHLSALDEFFEEPDPGVADDENGDETEDEAEDTEDNDEPEDAEGIDFDALTTAPTTFSGSVSTGIGAAVSLIDWPWTDEAQARDPLENYELAGGYDLSASFGVDARPGAHLRFSARMGTSLNPDSMSLSAPRFSRLFVDYTLAESIYFRVGRYGMTWGQGRVVGNPANFVSDVSDGMAVRAVVPAGRGSVTGLVYSKGAWVSQYSPQNPKAFAYAGQWETSLDAISLTAAGWGRYSEPLRTSASVSGSIGAFDLTVEAVNRWDWNRPFAPENLDLRLLTQVLWEGGDPSWVIIGEHLSDSTVPSFRGHRAGVALRMPRFGALGVNWRPQVRVRHAFHDNSGEVVTGLTGTVAPDLSMSIGAPFRYGPPGSYYRQGDFGSDLQDIGGVAALGLGVSLSFSF